MFSRLFIVAAIATSAIGLNFEHEPSLTADVFQQCIYANATGPQCQCAHTCTYLFPPGVRSYLGMTRVACEPLAAQEEAHWQLLDDVFFYDCT
ncbi:hypothetical protein C8R47DRAFT_1229646 [Mycena vitilis]|nr:hypothetical protein C8R47DRAFT_1229646 [Mycena vitilis]